MLDVSQFIIENKVKVLEKFNNYIKQWIVKSQAVSLWQPSNFCVPQQTFKIFIIISAELSKQSGIESMGLDFILWCCLWITQCTLRTPGTAIFKILMKPRWRLIIEGAPSVAQGRMLGSGVPFSLKKSQGHETLTSPFVFLLSCLAYSSSWTKLSSLTKRT